ncbi:MAG: 6-phosphofructokinase [Clostridiales bacterium]|nr:6-phosphofructokinase [Clostridiales bacterium]
MKKNLLVAQSGGPTAVINASLCGVIQEAMRHPEEIGAVYGAVNGIQGILEGRIVRVDSQMNTARDFELLSHTPASALGSCRYKMPAPDQGGDEYSRVLEMFRRWNIGYFAYIGGNDSMDTANKIAEYCYEHGEEVRVVGVPKTIDNDLPITDHCPGFGSAAKYIATTLLEIAADAGVYPMKTVTVVEIMGRNAGWLTAAACLARETGSSAPHLIYLPEAPFDTERFLEDVSAQLDRHDSVVVAVSEGVRLSDGSYVAESMQSGQVDAFGHKYLSGVGKYLERLIAARLGCKVRSVELSVLQRAAAHLQSATDRQEAVRAGEEAVRTMLTGGTRVMVAYRRVSDVPYLIDYVTAPLREVANVEHKIPREWINERGNDVTADLIRYLLPLIQGEEKCPMKNGMPLHFHFDLATVVR